MDWKEELGGKIKAARLHAGLTQDQLANKLPVSRVMLGYYEKGQSAIPVNILTEIARALQVDTFTVGGYRIVPEEYAPKPVLAPAQQLAFPFGEERRFTDASLRVDPTESSGGVIVTAVFREPLSA
ncbi:MAG: helix-turn-helix transcriptional regulator [Terracidiphilus sp.]|jgi:transcriptional regulator with XRE-family HTH domain